MPKECEYIDKLIDLFDTLPENLATYPRELTPILQMYWLCFRGVLVSLQLMLETHIPESFAIASRSAESLAVARKMQLHHEKIPDWINKRKETDQPYQRILGKLWPEEDRVLRPDIWNFYEITSEHGRHTGFSSTIFFTDFERLNTDGKVDFSYCDIDNSTNLIRSLNFLINGYIRFLKVFTNTIFKDYVSKDWLKQLGILEEKYNQYKETLREVFAQGQ